jgi:versiconal hemiacetal acetate esterase
LDDCVTAYYWAVKNSAGLNTTPNQAFTFGTSAGGNLALSTALKVIDEGYGEFLKGVVAVVPVAIAPEAIPEKLRSKYTSYEEHTEHTINTGRGMKTFFGILFSKSMQEPSN